MTKNSMQHLIEMILLEGFKDDQRYLSEKFPNHADDIGSLHPKWISWLIARFGENPTRNEIHPFGDSIVTVKNFARKDAAIGEKYRANDQFRTAVDRSFPPNERKWGTPSDISNMSVDEMELILGLSERKKQRFEVDAADDIEGDRIGKVGPWHLWLPTTREKSCKIAQYDPITLEPKTTWCTARTAGSNLFYNYVGRPGEEITLFYIIKDEPKSNTDWLSLGFVNGEPELSGKDGGLSVDRDNKGLTASRLMQILGPNHDEIMGTLTEKNRALGGKHPAREKIEAAAKSVKALDYLVKGLSAEESSDIKKMIFRAGTEIAPEVLMKLAGDPDDTVRFRVASNSSTPSEVLAQLAGDPNTSVRINISWNKSTPPEVLAQLAEDPNNGARMGVAHNPSTPPEILDRLAGDPNTNVRINIAKKRSTPAEILAQLAGDPNEYVRQGVAENRSTPTAILVRLASDPAYDVRQAVAINPSTPISSLKKLLKDRSKRVKDIAAIKIREREAAGITEARLRQVIKRLIAS